MPKNTQSKATLTDLSAFSPPKQPAKTTRRQHNEPTVHAKSICKLYNQTDSPPPTHHTQTTRIIVSAVAVLVVLLTLAFKKGYITIEVTEEENNEDYSI
jgi:hypothetical protein